MLEIWRGVDASMQVDQSVSQLAKVREYRNTFAEILVVGAILQRLEGDERQQFERFKTRDREAMEREQQSQQREAVEDLEDVAEQQFDGLTSKVLRRGKRSRTA